MFKNLMQKKMVRIFFGKKKFEKDYPFKYAGMKSKTNDFDWNGIFSSLSCPLESKKG